MYGFSQNYIKAFCGYFFIFTKKNFNHETSNEIIFINLEYYLVFQLQVVKILLVYLKQFY